MHQLQHLKGSVPSAWGRISTLLNNEAPLPFSGHQKSSSIIFPPRLSPEPCTRRFISPSETLLSIDIYKRNLLETRVIIASLYLVCICPIRWQRERHFEPCGHLDIEAFADFMRMLTPSWAILRMLRPTHSVACSDTDYVGPITSRTQSAHRNRE